MGWRKCRFKPGAAVAHRKLIQPPLHRHRHFFSVGSEIIAKPPGQLDAYRWIQEGDGLRASARSIRAQWYVQKRDLRRKSYSPTSTVGVNWSKLGGLPRASVLLLGYSAEMFLKAALAKVYRECRTEMFDRDVKGFGHDYARLAKAVNLPLQSGDEQLLAELKDFVLNSSRYPLFPDAHAHDSPSEKFTKMNALVGTIWNGAYFDGLDRLVRQIRNHAVRIDQDSKNPCTYSGHLSFGAGGYVSARTGGHLADRITFKLSDEMVASEKTAADVKELFSSAPHQLPFCIWDRATIIQDGTLSSIVIHAPPRSCAKEKELTRFLNFNFPKKKKEARERLSDASQARDKPDA